jgi:hypothetical protein
MSGMCDGIYLYEIVIFVQMFVHRITNVARRLSANRSVATSMNAHAFKVTSINRPAVFRVVFVFEVGDGWLITVTVIISIDNACRDSRLNNCSRNAICYDEARGYRCECVRGYVDRSTDKKLTGRVCEPPTPPTQPPRTCICKFGYGL